MSNLDKAADLILPHTGNCEKCESVGGACLDCEREANDAAQALAAAGLLAPDAPEPQEYDGDLVWPLADPDGWAVTATDDYIRLSDERGALVMVVDLEAPAVERVRAEFIARTGWQEPRAPLAGPGLHPDYVQVSEVAPF